jgi:hypothetical protein
LAQEGTSPQRASRIDRVTSVEPLAARSTTIRTGSVGATFQDGGKSRASSASSAIASSSARSWVSVKEAKRPHMGPACPEPLTLAGLAIEAHARREIEITLFTVVSIR